MTKEEIAKIGKKVQAGTDTEKEKVELLKNINDSLENLINKSKKFKK